MHTISRFFTLLVILMMLVPSVIAAPNENANTKGLKITDLSKDTMKEVKDDKVKGLKSSSSDIVVDEKGKNHIKLKDSKPSKDTKEHKKVKVSIPKSELQKIDADNDGKFGVLEMTDGGVVINQYIATTKQLTDGIPMTFSDVEINGFSGYRSETFANVKSGDILNTADISGTYTRTASADGAIPTYAQLSETSTTAWPVQPYRAYMCNGNANDISANASHGTATSVVFGSDNAIFNGVNSKISILTPGYNVSSGGSIVAKLKLNGTTTQYGKVLRWYTDGDAAGIWLQSMDTVGKMSWKIGGAEKTYSASIPDGVSHTYSSMFNHSSKQLITRLDGTIVHNTTFTALNTSSTATIGSIGSTQYMKMDLDHLIIFNRPLTESELYTFVAMGSGISFSSQSSEYVGYNVASGTEKIISTGGTATDVKYIDTSGGTRNVTIKTYYTADTTLSTETSTDDFYNASVVFSPSVALTNGTIARPIAPLYTGTAVLDSNNTNAVITQNRTHYTIYTGTLTAGSWAGYNVSIPNNANHLMWLDRIMQWVSGVGWNFVGTAPTDYTDDLSEEITVTVS